MKVILLQDVPKLGRKNDLKSVADGFGRNYLIPKGLARPATKGAVDELAQISAQEEAAAKEELVAAQKRAEELDGLEVPVIVKANDQGELYAQISAKMVVDALQEMGHKISLRQVTISEPIKKTGEYPVRIVFNDGIESEIQLIVSAEDEEEPEQEKTA